MASNSLDIPSVYGPVAKLLQGRNKQRAEEEAIQPEDPFTVAILTALLGPAAGAEFEGQNVLADKGIEALKSVANLPGPYEALPNQAPVLPSRGSTRYNTGSPGTNYEQVGNWTDRFPRTPYTRGVVGLPENDPAGTNLNDFSGADDVQVSLARNIPTEELSPFDQVENASLRHHGASPEAPPPRGYLSQPEWLDRVNQLRGEKGKTEQIYPRAIFGHPEDWSGPEASKRAGLMQTLKALGQTPKPGEAPPTGPMQIVPEPGLKDIVKTFKTRLDKDVGSNLDPAQMLEAAKGGSGPDVASRRALLEDWLSGFGYGPAGLAREQQVLSNTPNWRNNLNLIYRSPEGQPIAGIGLDQPGPEVGMFGNASNVPDILRGKATGAVAKQAMKEGAIPPGAMSQEAFDYMEKFLNLLLKRMPK